MIARSSRQIEYREEPAEAEGFTFPIHYGRHTVYIRSEDHDRASRWVAEGYTQTMRTPDRTLIFVTPDEYHQIRRDQAGCMGCLSHCAFSNWKDRDDYTTGKIPDPRSFCIQKTLQDIAHGRGDPIDDQLMFSGHNAYKFREDPFYANGFVPTVRQLVQRILTGY